MKKYKIIIEYDGTNYSGWQVQKSGLAVCQVLQDSFEKVFHKTIRITGASRTDAGVHALCQVAVFFVDLSVNIEKIIGLWNNVLPSDITIKSLSYTDDLFHPQHSVTQKTYWFHVFPERPHPFINRFGYHCTRPIDLDRLKMSLEIFVGKHDFRSFCTGMDMCRNTTRTIDSITVTFIKKYKVYRIEVKGKSFLRYMIRRIVGAALEVATKSDRSVSEIKKALEEKNPQQYFLTAPSKGLCLYKIVY